MGARMVTGEGRGMKETAQAIIGESECIISIHYCCCCDCFDSLSLPPQLLTFQVLFSPPSP